MNLRELAKQLKENDPVLRWMKEHNKKPDSKIYKMGSWVWRSSKYTHAELTNDFSEHVLEHSIYLMLPIDAKGYKTEVSVYMEYATEEDAIRALEVALRSTGEIK